MTFFQSGSKIKDVEAKLVYKNFEWKLTIGGVEVPNSKVVYDGLSMKNDEFPAIQVLLDSLEIDDIVVEENKGYVENELNDGVNGLR